MYIIKRNGKHQDVYFDKITQRNKKLSQDLNIDTTELSLNVIKGLKNGMTTREIDNLSYESSIYRSVYEPDYGILALRILCDDLHKSTPNNFEDVIDKLYNNKNIKNNKPNQLISDNFYNFCKKNIDIINTTINYKLDYKYSFFSLKTLISNYLTKINNNVVERPQSLIMKVALAINAPSNNNNINHEGNIERAMKVYEEMSKGYFIHASPTQFNAGSKKGQYASCFLLECPDAIQDDDNINIPRCWEHTSLISKFSGGIGINLSRVRGENSYISGTNGNSNGIIPLAKVFNEIGRYVNQGGRRKGAIALYLEPWHPDVEKFLTLKKSKIEELSAKDINIAMWIPDLFFKRLEKNEDWSLFCPHSYPELVDLYGEDFEKRYIDLEKESKMIKKVKSTDIFNLMLESIIHNGEPYMLSKDNVNNKSNQKNIGTITCSNLCTEIVEYHTPTSIAVCNLASISLSSFCDNGYNFKYLQYITEMVTENLNLIIDKTYYPIDFCANNNLLYRPIGIGVQGLADAFVKLGISWVDENNKLTLSAKLLNRCIFECIYYSALKKSCELSKEYGKYSSFDGSPASNGILQYDMANTSPITDNEDNIKEFLIEYKDYDIKSLPFNIPKLDWKSLKEDIKIYGLRNSLMIAPMPTASTSNILGNVECFEPFTSNVFSKKTLAGDCPIINPYLYKELKDNNILTKELVDNIIKNNGSVQDLNVTTKIKLLFKTVWEIPQKIIIDLAADRGAFIDQSQSMNIYMSKPTKSKLSSMYLYSWKKGLKTLSYYVRSQPAVTPIQFSILDISDPTKKLENKKEDKIINNKTYICDDMSCCSS